MKAVVTGGAGFIGSKLVNRLVSEGVEVLVIDNLSTGSLSNLEGEGWRLFKGDICDPLPSVEHDVLFHLASPVSVAESLADPDKYYHQIADGTENVLRWSERMGAKSVVLASTAAIYGDTIDLPIEEERSSMAMSPYAAAKLLAESMVDCSEIRTRTILRFFNVYGEGQGTVGGYASVIPIFRKLWEAGKPLTVRGDGEQTRDFIWVEDIVDALIKASLRGREDSQTYNVGSGEETSVNQIVEAFGGEVHYIPSIPEPMRSLACIKKIKKELDWSPSMSVESWIETIR